MSHHTTLARLRAASHGLSVHCLDCDLTGILNIRRLIVQLGADFPVHGMNGRFICTSCGSRRTEIEVHARAAGAALADAEPDPARRHQRRMTDRPPEVTGADAPHADGR